MYREAYGISDETVRRDLRDEELPSVIRDGNTGDGPSGRKCEQLDVSPADPEADAGQQRDQKYRPHREQRCNRRKGLYDVVPGTVGLRFAVLLFGVFHDYFLSLVSY
jgi:hypothetical protein